MESKYATRRDIPLKVDLSTEKALVIAITLLLTFVIPAQIYTYFSKPEGAQTQAVVAQRDAINQPEEENQPRVAGENSTRVSFQEDVAAQESFQISSKSAPFIALGGTFILVSAGILFVLLQTEKKPSIPQSSLENDEFAARFDI